MTVDLFEVSGSGFTFDAVELLAANLFGAELERFEYSSAPLELILREAGSVDECVQACGHLPAGCRLGELGVCTAAADECGCGDAVACEGCAAAVGVSDDPLA